MSWRKVLVKWFRLAGLGLALALTGCASSPVVDNGDWHYPAMAVPLQPSLQQEIQLARIDQLLRRADIDDDIRAKMFYERGLINDSLGLRDLARLDFNQSLALKPDQAEVFNILGVYYTQSREYDAAYEAFDSTLELAPQNQFALRNRAIALYYGGRYELAHADIQAHFQDEPSDPYRAIWLYLIESEYSPSVAKENLSESYSDRDDEWGWELVAMLLEEYSDQEFFQRILKKTRNNTLLAERLTEAYFYLGKRYQAEGDFPNAISLYKLAMAGNVYEYVEHRYALLELSRIFQQAQAEAQAKKVTQ